MAVDKLPAEVQSALDDSFDVILELVPDDIEASFADVRSWIYSSSEAKAVIKPLDLARANRTRLVGLLAYRIVEELQW